MDTTHPSLQALFRQLGLPDDPAGIAAFVAAQPPLPADVPLCDAAFWTPPQRQFLREAVSQDADWAQPVEILAVLLSRR